MWRSLYTTPFAPNTRTVSPETSSSFFLLLHFLGANSFPLHSASPFPWPPNFLSASCSLLLYHLWLFFRGLFTSDVSNSPWPLRFYHLLSMYPILYEYSHFWNEISFHFIFGLSHETRLFPQFTRILQWRRSWTNYFYFIIDTLIPSDSSLHSLYLCHEALLCFILFLFIFKIIFQLKFLKNSWFLRII